MTTEHEDFYLKYRNKMNEWIESKAGNYHKYTKYLMAGPDLFHLLVKLSLDREVSVSDKAKLAGAIAYFVSPIDLIPEAIMGPIGYVDDIALAAYVLNNIVNNTDPEIVKRHWVGDEDLLVIIKQILESADKMVGSGLWNKLRKRFS